MGPSRPWGIAKALLALISITFFTSAATGQAPSAKLALIIANSAYEGAAWPALKNPAADARLLKASFEQAGFRVSRPAVNLRRPQLVQRIDEFRAEVAKLPENSIALIYFSGHGIQVDGQNHLVPIGAGSFALVEAAQGAARDRVLDEQFVSLNYLLEVFGGLRRELPDMANILILDACRVNPLDGKTRSAGRRKGLADVSQVSNSLIAFAAEPGEVAYDGEGENSPFAIALAAEFKEKSLPLNLLFARARARTMELTGNEQRPIYQDALSGMVCLERCDLQRAVIAPRPASLAAKGDAATRGSGSGCEFCPALVPVKTPGGTLSIGRLPVSNREWLACVEESSCQPLGEAKPEDDLPVVGLSWSAARDYAAWLSDRTGQRWRLLSAEEWRAAFASQREAPRRRARRLPPLRTAAAEPSGAPGYFGQILEWTGSCPDGSPGADCSDRLALGATFDDDFSDLLAGQAFPAASSGKALGFRVAREDQAQ